MSRRDQIRMTHEEEEQFLAGAQTIIINSNGPNGYPHPMPMWFAIEDDGSVVMTTFSKSQKIKNIERDPRVSLLVEDGTVYSELRGVVIYGKAELVRDHEQIFQMLARIGVKNAGGAGNAPEPGALRKALMATVPKRTGVRIRRDQVISWDHRKLGGVY
jgi:nitroimidazol reductase NimA-like FMN-containing flavoprotein (pyridoxamine 5'-phosphate oxidase superfamily)